MANNAKSGNGMKEGLPRHIAIIMDGNNRWAKHQQQQGIAGHRAGATAAREVVGACARRGIEYLTLFAFSSENWDRPKREVKALMALFIKILQRDEINGLHEHGVRVRFIGNRERFSKRLRELMREAEVSTADNTALTVNVAADYGGRWDIVEAARKAAAQVVKGELKLEEIDVDLIQSGLSMPDVPMPDLCIRTGGERRISNFLLWQFAYTELYFTDTYWPDFDEEALDLALQDYAGRQRRFGKVSEQVASQCP